MVTYHIDTDNTYTEEVDEGLSVLNPSTSPTKSGFTFLGWREDTSADSDVLSTKLADGEPMALYAVFTKTITTSFNQNGGSGSVSSKTSYGYYNNGNTSYTSITLPANGFTRRGYTFHNWRLNSTSGTAYNVGASYTPTDNTTFYAYWTSNAFTTVFTTSGGEQIKGLSSWDGEADEKTSTYVNTRGCHYLKMHLYMNEAKIWINGVQVFASEGDTDYNNWYTFDISAYDSIQVRFRVSSWGHGWINIGPDIANPNGEVQFIN